MPVCARFWRASICSQNRTDEAARLYEDILRIKPDDTATMKELARCYIKSQRYDKAIETLSNLVKIQPQDAEVYAMLGLSLGQKNIWDKAAEYYQSVDQN